MSNSKKRSQHLVQLIIFAVFFIITTVLLIIFPFSKIINPKQITDFTTLSTDSHSKYVTLTIDTLYYSGFDYAKNDITKGHYYYALKDDTCLFLLLESQSEKTPKEKLTDVNISCKLVKDETALADLATSMAKQINWTRDGLLSITCPYIASTIHYPSSSARFFLIFFSVQVLFYFCGGLYHLYHLIKH